MRKTDIDRVPAPGFVFVQEDVSTDSGWHHHARHQVLYASSGMLELDAEGGRWLLPPRRMAWITADVSHRVNAHASTRLCTAYLTRELVIAPDFALRVFAAPSVAREMLLYGARWDIDRAPGDALAEKYFATLGALCLEWSRTPQPFCLPTPRSDELGRAVAWLLDHLDEEVSMDACAKAARVSGRTLARRFEAETALGFRQYVHTARMTRAMELLADASVNVTEVTFRVGFASLGAFSSAFKEFTGESPSVYRRRVLGETAT